MPKVVLLCNPRSRRNSNLMGLLWDASKRHNIEFFILDNIASLPESLERFVEQGKEHFVISGGDGTVQTVLSALINHGNWRPKLTLLGGGMTNIIAHDTGEKREPLKGLEISLQRIFQGEKGITTRRKTIRLSDTEKALPPHYGFLVGGLSFYTATMSSRKNVHRLGVGQMVAANMSLAWSIINAIAGRDGKNAIVMGEEVDLKIDDQAQKTEELTLFLATTLHRLLPLAHPFWGKGPGAIKTTTITYPPRQLWRAAIPLLRGQPSHWMSHHGYDSFNADRVKIGIRSPLMMDGETLYPPSGGVILETGPDVEFTRFI